MVSRTCGLKRNQIQVQMKQTNNNTRKLTVELRSPEGKVRGMSKSKVGRKHNRLEGWITGSVFEGVVW